MTIKLPSSITNSKSLVIFGGLVLIGMMLSLYGWQLSQKAAQYEFTRNQECLEFSTKIKNGVSYRYDKSKKSCEPIESTAVAVLPNCSYEIFDTRIREDWDGIHHEGKIKNTSEQTQVLKDMILKIYSEDKTLMSEGHDSFVGVNGGKDIPAGTAVTYSIHVFTKPAAGQTQDLYPWFTTCK